MAKQSVTPNMAGDQYREYLANKALSDPMTGMKRIPKLAGAMFPFQRDIVAWALRRGRAAIFAGTGLGKTLMELSWANAVAKATNKPVLIFTPLAVAIQFVGEGAKFGIAVTRAFTQADITKAGVYVTNYEKLAHFDMTLFGGVVLDESSRLKAYDGKTRNALIEGCRQIPYRLAATATPAPNDFMELGNHAEFLGVMSYVEMLAMFFVHDGGDTAKWRLKGHAGGEFWKWMCSWAVMLTKPSDLGYANDGYDLPPLILHQHTVSIEHDPAATGMLIPMEARTMSERLGARRGSIDERVAMAASLIDGNDRLWVAWCNLNAESEALTRAIPGAVETRGSDSDDVKEGKLQDFSAGNIRVLVTKASVAGWGMHWAHCSKTAFVGLNDSFEQVFQAVRRFWRFGQTEEVNAHFIAAETEGAVVANQKRKAAEAEVMIAAMVENMADLSSTVIKGTVRDKASYAPKTLPLPSFLEL